MAEQISEIEWYNVAKQQLFHQKQSLFGQLRSLFVYLCRPF